MSFRLTLGVGLIPASTRPAPTSAPVNVVAPSITGILTQGQAGTCDPGEWTQLPSPAFTYQWKRSGVNISGATNATYVFTADDVSAGASAITCTVTATNSLGSTDATSAGVTIAAELSISGTPGEATVGAPYSFIPETTGGHGPYGYALTGTLASGWDFDTASGEISTEQALVAETMSDLSITVTDVDGLKDVLGPFSITVSAESDEGDGYTAVVTAFQGASNISGNQDGSGITVVTHVQDRVANPSDVINNGQGGNGDTDTLARYNASSTTIKEAHQIIQLVGNNDADESPRGRLSVFRDILAAFTANSVPDWNLTTSFSSISSHASESWREKRLFVKLANALWPGKVAALNRYTTVNALFPQLDAADREAAAKDLVPPTYMYDTSHMNGTGYDLQGDAWANPFVRGMSNVLPCLMFYEVYSTEATANTNGGLVDSLVVIGDLADCTVELLNHTDKFAVAVGATGVGTSRITLTRASSGALAAAFYDLQIRITKGTIRDTYRVRVGIGDLSNGVHEVSFANNPVLVSPDFTGWQAGMIEPMRNQANNGWLASGTKFSFFVKFRQLELGVPFRLIHGGSEGITGVSVTPAGNTSTFVRDGTDGTTSVVTHNALSGWCNNIEEEHCVFFSVDMDAAIYFARYEKRNISTGVVAAAAEPSIIVNKPGSVLGLGVLTQRGTVSLSSSAPVPIVMGAQWEAADFIDFREEANRALFRDATTFVQQNNYDEGNFDAVTAVAGVGSGGVVVPYLSIRGNAADRVLGRCNNGYGTAQITDPDDAGGLAVVYTSPQIETVA